MIVIGLQFVSGTFMFSFTPYLRLQEENGKQQQQK